MNTLSFACSVRVDGSHTRTMDNRWLKRMIGIHSSSEVLVITIHKNPLLVEIFTSYRGITTAMCCVVIRAVWQTLTYITSFSFGFCRSTMVLVYPCVSSPLQRYPPACPLIVARPLPPSSFIPYVAINIQLAILPSRFLLPYWNEPNPCLW